MTRIAWHAERIARSASVEAPRVDAVNLQVRTGMSVPFAPHMLGDAEAPSVKPVNLQVRTGMSVPFASYMVADKPAAAPEPQAKASAKPRKTKR